MSTYYNGKAKTRPSQPVELAPILRDEDPAHYVADDSLAAAVNVALVLGKPLLLTGQPGTGKTELAGHVAMALGLAPPRRFDTRSNSLAMDLFYRFDTLARFSSSQSRDQARPAIDFVTLGPLGTAILRTLDPTDPIFETLSLAYPCGPGEVANPSRSVVLIDEIDKAPRDFPNDLLDAVDNLRFVIRELERETLAKLTAVRRSPEISADRTNRPVIIVTSNSEKNLPDAFLRRCAYYNIPLPEGKDLEAIIARRVPQASAGALVPPPSASSGGIAPEGESPLLRSAVAFFEGLQTDEMRKRPSTAELIDWTRYLLRAGAKPSQTIGELGEMGRLSLGTLVKCVEDIEVATKAWNKVWKS